MTLVLGTRTDNAVILSADSKVGDKTDRKLFSLDTVVFVSFGSGPPTFPRDIDIAIDRNELAVYSDTKGVCDFLRDHFSAYSDAGVLVGGFDTIGSALLRQYPINGPPEILSADIIWGSPRGNYQPCDSEVARDIIFQMLSLLKKAALDFPDAVGEPFKFLHIQRNDKTLHEWNGHWLTSSP